MKNILLYIILITPLTFFAQVGIGTTAPDASAMLDIQSTTSGFAMPRMSTTERTSIANPVNGLQVYDTNYKNIWFYDGNEWRTVSPVAYGRIKGNGTPFRIVGASAVRESTGIYKITFNKKMPTNNYIISISLRSDNSRRDLGVFYKSLTKNSFKVYIYNSDNGTPAGDLMNSQFSFSVHY